ncbi:uncharacterized protein BJ171DRAFT_516761 [Polychytrium aggregatum]|uniref:uncharacterized protein n=1 Tax=Polychytrium aggregatum TaxID=110093 RepID=UPI0022FF1182|nr:uncharacterized protein BJ171DRAFT_516761 [Polychytrium aggregatum]KAI9201872.1 hypothetical protein BJ171DRAFT_516761 [Polychytrium aggregatum]
MASTQQQQQPQRPEIVGPESPADPFPLMLKGDVARGFGRGGKELGIPTANMPEPVAESAGSALDSGIYYGWSSIGDSSAVWPMVMSFGWNPYYKNEKRSMEVHILNKFEADFYGEELRIIITGFIRPEKDYSSLDALIDDINFDIKVARNSLGRPAYNALSEHSFLAPSN